MSFNSFKICYKPINNQTNSSINKKAGNTNQYKRKSYYNSFPQLFDVATMHPQFNKFIWLEIGRHGFCKVEFNQSSCWLYSMPNLLVFQQLETLYLGGNYVRVVCVRECQELLKCVQRSRDLWLDFAGDSRLQAAKLEHMCQVCQKLKRRASYSLQDKSSRLAKPFARGLNLRLNLVARSSCQNTLFGKI